MPEPFSRLARDRLQQLSGTLTTLRERVRDAVASEMGKAAGDTLRDLLIAILNRNAPRPTSLPVPAPIQEERPDRERWDDDDPDWREEPVEPVLRPAQAPERKTLSMSRSDALRLGVGVARWLIQRRLSIFAGIGVGLAAGLATLVHHPLVQTGLAVIAAATQLLAITEFSPA